MKASTPLRFTRFGLLALAGFVGANVPPTTGAAEAAPPKPALIDHQPAQQHTAIENVCAWPNLMLLPDGKTIIATLFNQPSHARMIGGVDCWASEDGGQTWIKRSTAVAPTPGVLETRMNHAAGLAANGDLLVVAGGWTLYPKPNVHGPYEVDKLIRPTVSRSSDGGRTWTQHKDAFPAAAEDGKVFVPFGVIVRARDGSLRLCAYTTANRAYVLSSKDDGNTWGDPVRIETTRKLTETTLWSDGKGRILAAARTLHLEIFDSEDDGRTWKDLSAASDRSGYPGDLRLLSDGRLLATCGNRTKGKEGVDARVSGDGGKTWSAPVRIANFETYDGGYPSSVQRADGKVVTAFYAHKTKDRDAYQMGVTIWDPIESFGPATAHADQ